MCVMCCCKCSACSVWSLRCAEKSCRSSAIHIHFRTHNMTNWFQGWDHHGYLRDAAGVLPRQRGGLRLPGAGRAVFLS